MSNRKTGLRLSRETVREISTGDLGGAAGGSEVSRPVCNLVTGIYPSINVDCTSIVTTLVVIQTLDCLNAG